jgi:hypothetical protein
MLGMWHRVLRRRINAEYPGSVHIPVKRHRTRSARRISAYMAKYLGKTFESDELAGRKRYWHSEGARDSIRMTRWTPAARTWEGLVIELCADECVIGVRHFEPQPGVLWMEGWTAGRMPLEEFPRFARDEGSR